LCCTQSRHTHGLPLKWLAAGPTKSNVDGKMQPPTLKSKAAAGAHISDGYKVETCSTSGCGAMSKQFKYNSSFKIDNLTKQS